MPHHDTLRAQDDPFDIDVGEDEDDEHDDDDDEDEEEEEEGGWQVGCADGPGLTLYG